MSRHCERAARAKQSSFIMRILCWIASSAFGFLAMTNEVFADSYKPGTAGYVYENCVTALEKSASPAEFLPTYCGGFAEGYGMGVLAANSFALGEPNDLDPCKEEKKKEYERINARLCKNLPDYRDTKTPPGTILQTAANIVARWHSYLLANKKEKALKQSAITEINTMITPGTFCDSLDMARTEKPLAINPALLEANWYDFVKTGAASLQDKYNSCKKELEAENFSESRCAAEITGFMTGLYSTAALQERKPAKGTCKKEVDRLYESLDMTGRLCLSPETSPELVAKIFLARVESLKSEGENLRASGFGAVGYQSIYYGLLCRAQ